jgi:hypothetical protein
MTTEAPQRPSTLDDKDAHHFETLTAEFREVFTRTLPDGSLAFSAADQERIYPVLLMKAVSLAGWECLSPEQQTDLTVALHVLGAEATTSPDELALLMADYLQRVTVDSALLEAVQAVFVRHGERLARDGLERAGEAFAALTGDKRPTEAPHVDEAKPDGARSPQELEQANNGRFRV